MSSFSRRLQSLILLLGRDLPESYAVGNSPGNFTTRDLFTGAVLSCPRVASIACTRPGTRGICASSIRMTVISSQHTFILIYRISIQCINNCIKQMCKPNSLKNEQDCRCITLIRLVLLSISTGIHHVRVRVLPKSDNMI